jgi:hypothetical protein
MFIVFTKKNNFLDSSIVLLFPADAKKNLHQPRLYLFILRYIIYTS